MSQRLEGKTALVTGGTSNIGRAIAIALAREGADVVVSGRNEARAADVLRAIREGGGRAHFVASALDGTAKASRELADTATRALGGRLDILVNNAGIFPGATTATTDEVTFDQVYAVNVKAPFFLTAAVAPAMAARGAGAIINISSTKGAIETLTRAWAAEFGPAGVRVNAISPGVIREAGAQSGGDVMMQGTPANKAGRPEAVASAAVYLASDEATFVHGAVLDVDGGRVGVAVIFSATPS